MTDTRRRMNEGDGRLRFSMFPSKEEEERKTREEVNKLHEEMGRLRKSLDGESETEPESASAKSAPKKGFEAMKAKAAKAEAEKTEALKKVAELQKKLEVAEAKAKKAEAEKAEALKKATELQKELEAEKAEAKKAPEVGEEIDTSLLSADDREEYEGILCDLAGCSDALEGLRKKAAKCRKAKRAASLL